jgi:putative thioredoxin
MSANAYDVSVADFDQKVLAASRSVPVIVDFWAEWCQPCRLLKPILEKLAAEYGGRFLLGKVNSDENQELAVRYGVRGIPAVKAFLGGEPVDEFTGALPEGKVREFLDRLIPSPAEPLRLEAADILRGGDIAGAIALLTQALQLDSRNEAARLDLAEALMDANAIEDARSLLDTFGDAVKDAARLGALHARLALCAGAGNTDSGVLAQAVADNPGDLDSRLRLANALALARNYRPAMEHLLEIVRRDRAWNDQAGRKTLLTLFNLLAAQPECDDLIREFRVALARTLN